MARMAGLTHLSLFPGSAALILRPSGPVYDRRAMRDGGLPDSGARKALAGRPALAGYPESDKGGVS